MLPLLQEQGAFRFRGFEDLCGYLACGEVYQYADNDHLAMT